MSATHIVVLPGRGYPRHAEHEGEPVAEWLRSPGIDAGVFVHPVLTEQPAPLDAVRGELRRVRGSVDMVPVYRLAGAGARDGIAHAVHVHPSGVHGPGLAEGSALPQQWTSEAAAWLRDLGWVS